MSSLEMKYMMIRPTHPSSSYLQLRAFKVRGFDMVLEMELMEVCLSTCGRWRHRTVAATLAVTAARVPSTAAKVVCTAVARGSQGGRRALASCPWHHVQLSHRAVARLYVGGDAFASSACRADGQPLEHRGTWSSILLTESNCYRSDGPGPRLGEARRPRDLVAAVAMESR